MARMRSAGAPRRRSAGTRSRNAMSSSMVIVVGGPRSRHQFVATGFGNQDRGRGRILLDLLPQSIDVRLQRVRSHARIITPDLLQQRLARYRPLAGAIKIAKDRGLLLRQTDFIALGVEQDLRTRPKRVWADDEDRVLARFMLAKLRPDARQQHGEA